MTAAERAAAVGLTGEEYAAIEARLGRSPNDVELGMFGALWSEHCSYKSTKALLARLGEITGPALVQGPGGNAGVVRLEAGGPEIAFKIESHNHPSYVEPVEGAATGVGGILRDIIAMGARPIAVLDSLRFGTDGASGRIADGVVEGIGRYGNSIGIPTVGGEVGYGSVYDRHPLVNVMAIGVRPSGRRVDASGARPGCRLLLAGQATGRDGIHGASLLASRDVGEAAGERSTVQVGDPFTGKLLMEFTLAAVELSGVRAVQDLGAAGLTSALAELLVQSGAGARVTLDRVPLRAPDMTPYEILLSESQERMLLAVEAAAVEAVAALARRWELAWADIGTVTAGDRLQIWWAGDLVADLPASALVQGCPRRPAPGQVPPPRPVRTSGWLTAPAAGDALAVLAHGDVRDRAPIYRRYDHTILAGTVQGPEADTAILRLRGARSGLAATVAGPGRWCREDARVGTLWAAVRCAVRLGVAGAQPLGFTDGINAGNPDDPDVYADIARMIDGLAEAARLLGIPVTGGNVSLHNQSWRGDRSEAIWPTPVIGAVGVHPRPLAPRRRRLPPGARLWLLAPAPVADPEQALGGSVYALLKAGRAPLLPLDWPLIGRLLALLQEPWWEQVPAALRAVANGGVFATLAHWWREQPGAGAPVLEADGAAAATARWFGEQPQQVVLAVTAEAEATVLQRVREAGVAAAALGRLEGRQMTLAWPDGRLAWSLAEVDQAVRWQWPGKGGEPGGGRGA